MSPVFGRDPVGHDRARELAAIRVDEPLAPAEEAWLEGHLLTCADCAEVAGAFDADRMLFAGLRDAPPMPPRDMWARTAAAIDAEAGYRRGARRGGRFFGIPALTLAPVAGFAVVALVVGAGLLNGSPVVPPPAGHSGPPPTPIALAPGDVAVLSRGSDGTYQVQTGTVDEVCPLGSDTCAAQPSFEATQLARIGGSDSVGAIISPSKDRLVVVQRGATGSDGVYVVPVKPAGSGTATATTHPSEAPASGGPATSAPATGAPGTSAPATAGAPSEPPESGEPTATLASATPSPDASASAPVEPSVAPSASASVEPTATPEATREATPEPTQAPEPTPTVAVTPGPGGDAIQIAKDVVVVGDVAAYNADGSRFAFTARPADGSVGPDVYVWNTSESIARAVTADHRSLFAGWDGKDLLVSRVVDGTPRTFAVNARTGATRDGHVHQAWLPAVAPGGASAAWWDGSVDLADDDLTWVPDKGRLVLGDWPGTGGDEQVLAKGSLRAWEVRWNADGTVVGVWTATGAAAKSGRLSLYPVDPATGRAELGSPILDDVPAYAGFALENGRLVYPGPGTDGARSLWVVAWKGGTVVGRVELDGEGGATVIR